MYYIVYETTNKANGMKYRGVHQTKNLDDGYLGSGRRLVEVIEQFGDENFSRKILSYCSSSREMYELEKKYVNKDWVDSNNTYNLKLGGQGGWAREVYDSDKQREKGAKGLASKKRKTKEYKAREAKTGREVALENWRTGKFNVEQSSKAFLGKHHTETTKKIIGSKNSAHQLGSRNSQYGTCWIMNEDLRESKRINASKLLIWINKGWAKGRRIKWDIK